MTIHPCLLPTLLVATASTVAAAALRSAVRKEYAVFLPWLWPWGILCTLPALAYAGLCLPGFGETAAHLNETMSGTWAELLAGAAGVLPGLIWDWTAERIEQRRAFPFGLSEAVVRAIPIAALLIVLLIPYVWLFEQNQRSVRSAGGQTEIAAPAEAASPAGIAVPSEAVPSPEQP